MPSSLRSVCLAVVLALAGCTGPQGPAGERGPTGDPGAQGQPGPAGDAGTDAVLPTLKNDVLVVVTDGAAPLEGVTVTVTPGGATATTNATGRATLAQLDLGAWLLTFHLAGFVDQTAVAVVNLTGPTTVSVSLAVDPAAAGPTVTVTDQLAAGFAAPVTVTAATPATGVTWAWRQVSGPAVTLGGAATATVSFTTIGLAAAKGTRAIANARFGVLGLDPDQAGNYQLEVTATDARGHATKATVTVNAARPTTDLRMVPVGVRVFLQGDGALVTTPAPTAWNWTLDASGAAGSTATLRDATTQFPSFVPDKAGVYVLTESVAAKTMKLYAGTWRGAMTDATQTTTCAVCHSGTIASDTFTPWKATKHATALQRKLEGSAGPHFTEACLGCHTVGYDKTAANGGFDDLMATAGWAYPAVLQPGNWAALLAVPGLGDLAGIQCESCHGPQTFGAGGPHASSAGATPDFVARISWSADVCASCHQEAPYHYKPSQWALGKHSDRTLAIAEGTAERNSTNLAHCGRCHAAQGFGRYVEQLAQGYTGHLTNDGKPLGAANHRATATELSAIGLNVAQVESQTCAACHDPHAATNRSQLRVFDSIAMLPSGMGVSGMGAGAVCAACHNSRNGEHTDFALNTTDSNGAFMAQPALVSFGGPHSSSQTDVVFGFNAFFMSRLNPSRHLAVTDTCAGCHYKAATSAQQASQQTSNHSFVADATICAACHGANVDGAALKAANKAQLDALRALWASKLRTSLAAAISYVPPTGTMVVAGRAWDPVSGLYSTPSSTFTTATAGAVPFSPANLPVTVTSAYNPAGTLMLAITFASPVTFQPVDGTGAAVGSPVTSTVLYVAPSSLITNQAVPVNAPYWPAGSYYTPFMVPAPRSVTTTYPPLPPAPPWVAPANVQVLAKAYWNFSLLLNDATYGLHNPSFFNDVVSATSRALMALP